MADFSNQTMNVEPFDGARDLGAAFPGKFIPEVFVLKATDRELPACYGFKEQLVLIVKEIEAFVGTFALNNGLRDLVQFFDPYTGIIDGGDELDVSAIGCKEKLAEGRKRVDAFLHLGEFL